MALTLRNLADGDPGLSDVMNDTLAMLALLLLGFALVLLPAVATRCADQRRQAARQQEEEEETRDRLAFVQKRIVIRQWSPDEVTVGSGTDTDASGEMNNKEERTNVDDADQYNDCGDCPICLADFCEGDLVVESPNPRCRHTLHLSCMQEWLIKHDTCPICRETYLMETV